jgi:uncharacterized membrane-anchored protein
MKPAFAVLLVALAIGFLAAPPLLAQEADPEQGYRDFMETIDWVHAPQTGELGDQATIVVPEGFVFTGTGHTQRLMTFYDNLLTDQEVGFIAPVTILDPNAPSWFVVFEFDPIGYVENADEEEIDADAILESLKEGNKQGNEQRRRMGMQTLTLSGWAKPPYYDPQTRNLEWATKLLSGGQTVINHNIRILGRRGVMQCTLVCSPNQFNASLAAAKIALEGFTYKTGQTYGEYRSGDKIWKYGLTGLIVGGGAALALKTGLFAKLWKVLWKVLVFGGIGIAAIWRRITGGKKNVYQHATQSTDEAPPEA